MGIRNIISRIDRLHPLADLPALSAQNASRWERAAALQEVSLLPEYMRLKQQTLTASWKP